MKTKSIAIFSSVFFSLDTVSSLKQFGNFLIGHCDCLKFGYVGIFGFFCFIGFAISDIFTSHGPLFGTLSQIDFVPHPLGQRELKVQSTHRIVCTGSYTAHHVTFIHC